MLDGIINRTPIPILHKILNVSSKRYEAIASNIANVQTPGYQRKDVQFDELLKESIKQDSIQGLRSDPGHLPVGEHKRTSVLPAMEVLNSKESSPQQNNVKIEKEMTDLASNQQVYATVARMIAGNFKSLSASIKGRF